MTVFPKNARVAFIGDSITASVNFTARVAAYYVRHLPRLAEWNSLAGKITSIYAVEWMVVCNFDLPKDEKLALVQKTIDDGKWEGIPYFQSITANYMKNKPHEEDMLARMDAIWAEIYNRYI